MIRGNVSVDSLRLQLLAPVLSLRQHHEVDREQKDKENEECDKGRDNWFDKPAVELSRDRLITNLIMDPESLGSLYHEKPTEIPLATNNNLTIKHRKHVGLPSLTSGKLVDLENTNRSCNGGHHPSEFVAQQRQSDTLAPLPSVHSAPHELLHNERTDSHVKQPVPQTKPDLVPATGDEQRPKLSVKQRKKERRQKRREKWAATEADNNPAQTHTTNIANEEPTVDQVIHGLPSPQIRTSIAPLPASATPVASPGKDSEISSRDPALDIDETFCNELVSPKIDALDFN